MTISYEVQVDHELAFVEASAKFLEGEFGSLTETPKWSAALFFWKLSEVNPSGKGILVVAKINEKIIATASLTIKRVIVDGVEMLSGEIGDTYSAEKLRRLAIPGSLLMTNQDANHYVNKSIFGRLVSEITNLAETLGCQIIYGTPNQNSLPGYVKKLGFSEIKGYKNTSRSMPTSLYFEHTARVPRAILKICIPIISKIFFLYRSFILNFFKPSGVIVKNSLPLDKDINGLWESCKPSKGFSLIKDSKYYNYRFRDHPLEQYDYHSFYLNGELSCVIVSCIKTDKTGNDIIIICDHLTNKKIRFLYVLNYIVDAHSHLPVLKFNFWCEKYSNEYMSAFFSGFIGGSLVPIIFFSLKKGSVLGMPNLKMDFHLSSSDNI